MQDNLSSLLGAMLGQGRGGNNILRKGDHAAASMLLDIRGDDHLVKAGEALITGAVILIHASRKPDTTLETLQLLLEDMLTSSIERVLEQTHAMMHMGDEELAASPYQGSMVATVIRGMSEDNELGTVTHDELIAYLDGPLAETNKANMARMLAIIDSKKEPAKPTT